MVTFIQIALSKMTCLIMTRWAIRQIGLSLWTGVDQVLNYKQMEYPTNGTNTLQTAKLTIPIRM